MSRKLFAVFLFLLCFCSTGIAQQQVGTAQQQFGTAQQQIGSAQQFGTAQQQFGIAQQQQVGSAPGQYYPYGSIASGHVEERRQAGGLDNFSRTTAPLEIVENLEVPQEKKKGKLFQKLGIEARWTPTGGDEGLGLTQTKFNLTIALPGPPIACCRPSFFLLTPTFEYTSVDHKVDWVFPKSLYNAGMNIMWVKPINERWSFMAGASPSWASDGKAKKDAVRCPAMVGFTWTPNKQWKIVFGAAYLDRSDVPFLPYGGLVYTPNDEWRFELMAPQARVAKQLYWRNDPLLKHWGYLGFGFGGGTWAVESVAQEEDIAMYREFSLLLGYERVREEGVTLNFELAWLFGRRVEFDHGTQWTFKPEDALCLRVKFQF